MIGSILSSAISNYMGMSKTVFFGGLGLTMLVFCQTIPAWRATSEVGDSILFMDEIVVTILVLGSMVAGFG